MTTATINGKRASLSIQEKARFLKLLDISKPNEFAVISGSSPDKAYIVRHNGRKATDCNCNSRIECSHMLAVNLKLEGVALLEAKQEREYVVTNNLYPKQNMYPNLYSCHSCGQLLKKEGYCYKCMW